MQLDVSWFAESAQTLIDDVGGRLESATPMLSLLGDALLAYEVAVFATEAYGKWAPDSPATVAAKGNGRVLVDTGALKRSLTSSSAIKQVGESVELSSDERSFAFLRAGARGAPPRDPAPPPAAHTIGDWAESAARYLLTGKK